MDKEIEKEMIEEVEKLMNYLFYRIREISGEFPIKMRVTTLYPPSEKRETSHFMETERILPMKDLEVY